MIKFSNKLTIELLNELFSNKILAIAIVDYKPYENENEIYNRLYNLRSSSSYTYEENLVSHIGNSSYEIDLFPQRFKQYYENIELNNRKIKNLFYPHITPIEELQKNFNKLWKAGLKFESLHNRKMFAGIIRIIHKGSAIHAHQDNVRLSNPSATNVEDIIGQFGINYFLKVPSSGGRLMMWNKELNTKDFSILSNKEFCIPIKNLPPPDLFIKPKKGMLTIINANKLHAIECSYDEDRITLSCFLAYRGKDKHLTIWS